MMSLRVTSLEEEEGADVDEADRDGVEWLKKVANPDCLKLNCSLHLTVAASMAHMLVKWLDAGKGIEKWRKILVIAEGKMSLSRDVVSL